MTFSQMNIFEGVLFKQSYQPIYLQQRNDPRTVLGRVQPRLIVCVCVCLSVCLSVWHHLNAYISGTNKDTTMKLGRYVGKSVRLIVLKFHEIRKSYYVTMT